MSPGETALRDAATEALRQVIDPELGLDVVELGLVQSIEVEGGVLRVALTMTTPACPLGEHIVAEAGARLRDLEGVAGVDVRLTWDPPWSPARLSAAAREALGW